MPSVIGKAGPPADLRRFMEKRLDGEEWLCTSPASGRMLGLLCADTTPKPEFYD